MIVDSCINSRTQRPVALEYLESIGVRTVEAVKLFVVTHWHNDHMRGASNVLREAKSAELFCSAALDIPEFYELVAASTSESSLSGQVPEFAEMFKILEERHPGARPGTFGPEWVMEDRRIYHRTVGSGPACSVYALSPSSATMNIAHLELAPFLPEYNKPIRRPVGISPNRLAVVLWIEFADTTVLLGSDLEESGNATMGWQAIVGSRRRPTTKAHGFKVPHHGSENAHNDAVWTDLLVRDPMALVAPYAAGPTPRPSPQDIAYQIEDAQPLLHGAPHGVSTTSA